MRPSSLLVIILLLTPEPATLDRVVGTVRDSDGCALEGAAILLSSYDIPSRVGRGERPCFSCEGLLSATTDSLGHFTILLAPWTVDSFDLWAKAWGYKEVLQSVKAGSADSLTRDFALPPDSVEQATPHDGRYPPGYLSPVKHCS